MDEHEIYTAVNRCKHLKYKFQGVFACNNFPLLKEDSFQVVNTAPSWTPGTHWIVLCKRRSSQTPIFIDPLGKPLQFYKRIFMRCVELYDIISDMSIPIQPPASDQCAVYCLYLAHVVFSSQFPNITMVDDFLLRRFVKHFLSY